MKKGAIETFLSYLRNVKYSYFRPREVVLTAEGKLIFADVAETQSTAEEQLSTEVDSSLHARAKFERAVTEAAQTDPPRNSTFWVI
jgi:hypothetical protein